MSTVTTNNMRPDPLLRWFRHALRVAVALDAGWIAVVLLLMPFEEMPWTGLSFEAPASRKIEPLIRDRRACIALLRSSGLRVEPLPPHGESVCAADDAVRVAPAQAMLSFSPAAVAPSCPVVAGLAAWQWQVLQPAAQRIFGASVARITHYGSYSCRRLYGRGTGSWSEHATANAIDVSGFILTDGTRIVVERDWSAEGPKARFLHAARDGACGLFSTVLSPDYNAAHRNHFHLDQATRGEWGGRACR